MGKLENWQAPVFILADDDRGAVERITELLHPEWFYVTVTKPRLVARYARRLPVTAVFLAAPLEYPGGTVALLQHLVSAVGKPVIILAEDWSSETATYWKQLGAEDCLPHPTRFNERLEQLRRKMQALALQSSSAAESAGAGR